LLSGAVMRLRLRFALGLACSSLLAAATGCSTATLPPPAAPARVEPAIEEPPKDAAVSPNGRVVLDTEGESATVSRVTQSANVYGPAAQYKTYPPASSPLVRQEELLCVTPCAVDLRQGAHQFVFKSQKDPVRVSTADVVVTSQPIFVRHALGREARMSSGYVTGAGLLIGGIGASLIGGGLAGIAAIMPERDSNGSTTSSEGLLTAGLVTLGIGVVTGTIGGLIMGFNRPAEQPGATTQWRRE